MVFDFALLIAIIGGFLLFISKGPAKLVALTLMCFEDRVNLLNVTCAMGAFTLSILSKTSELATLITPIIICVSAVVVLLYNVAKLIKIHSNKDEE